MVTFIKQSLGNSPSLRLFTKRVDEKKFPFITTTKWVVLAIQWSVKHFFFAPNSPLFGKSGGEKKKKRGNYEAFCLLSKHNKKRISYQMVCKTFFFAPNSPLFGKSGGEKKKKRGNYEAFCFSSKHNKKRINFNAIHFSKIHRSILRKITIDLLYFWDVYDVSLWEKNFGRSTAYSCRTNIFI